MVTLCVTALCLLSVNVRAIGRYTGTFEIESSDYNNLLVGDTYAFTITIVDAPDEHPIMELNNHDAISSFSLTKTGGSSIWSGFSSNGGNDAFQFYTANNSGNTTDYIALLSDLTGAQDLQLTASNFTTVNIGVDRLELVLIDTDLTSLDHSVAIGELLSDVLNRPLDEFFTMEVRIYGDLYNDPDDGYVYSDARGIMTFNAVPEPTSLLLLGLGAVILIYRRLLKKP